MYAEATEQDAAYAGRDLFFRSGRFPRRIVVRAASASGLTAKPRAAIRADGRPALRFCVWQFGQVTVCVCI